MIIISASRDPPILVASHERFNDAPKDRGLLVNTPEHLYQWIAGADKAGLHVMVHAIGDRANGLLLDIFERVIKENGGRDRRFRIEHAQHLARPDIPASGSSASSRACSRITRSTMDAGQRSTSAIGSGRRTRFDRCSTQARCSRSAATGSSRRRRRSRGSTPP